MPDVSWKFPFHLYQRNTMYVFLGRPVLSARSLYSQRGVGKQIWPVSKSPRALEISWPAGSMGLKDKEWSRAPANCHLNILKLSWCSEKYSAFEAETDLIVIILGISWDLGAGESVQGPRLTRKDSTLILYNFIVSPWQFNVLLHADFSKALLLSVAWRSRSDVSQSLTWLCLYYSVRSATSR